MFALRNQNSNLQTGPHLGVGTHTTRTQMVLLLYYYPELWDVCELWCICECVCYYVELCLILPLVMCLSYRYGRRSTPEHNYLALQKSLCPQGKTEQRGTVMLQAAGWDMHIGIGLYSRTDGGRMAAVLRIFFQRKRTSI